MASATTFVSVASVVVLTLVLFPLDASAIWCFQCNSQFDEGCANMNPNDTSSPYYRQCSDEDHTRTRHENGSFREFFCRKIIQTIYDRDGLTRVVRRCGWMTHHLPCYSYDTEGHKDIVCQCFTDACNSATALGKSWPVACLSGLATLLAAAHFRST